MTLSVNMRGAALMVASMVCYTANDAFMKAVAVDVPFFEAVFLRGMLTTVLLLLLARRLGHLSGDLSGRDRLYLGLRTLGEVASTYFFINALFHMPLANISAIMQALPLTVSLAGALFLREAVGWRRLSAILIGFVGVMLIVRPGPEGFNLYAIYGLAAVASVTLRDLTTRKISSAVPSLLVAVAASLAVTVFGAVGALQETVAPISLAAAAKLGFAALFILGGYVFSVMVMRAGDIGFIAPFRYTSLLTALILGLAVFGEWPDAVTLLGAGIVVATGIFTLYRERRISRAQLAALRVR